MIRQVRYRCALGALVFLASTAAFAQAWVAPKGQGSLAFTYQNLRAEDQLFSQGPAVESGTAESNNGLLSVDYTLIDRLALSASVAYISSSYDGPFRHGTTVDDGDTHGTLQDGSVSLRYVALDGPVKITPFLGYGRPLTGYETLSISAPGRGLDQIPVGLALGWSRKPSSPDFFLQARYTYLFVEDVQGFDTDRWLADLELGYLFTRHLTGFAFYSYQDSKGGLDLLDVTSETFPIHDQVIALQETRVGLGLSVRVGGAFSLTTSYSETIDGANVQEQRVVTLGVRWSFGSRG